MFLLLQLLKLLLLVEAGVNFVSDFVFFRSVVVEDETRFGHHFRRKLPDFVHPDSLLKLKVD